MWKKVSDFPKINEFDPCICDGFDVILVYELNMSDGHASNLYICVSKGEGKLIGIAYEFSNWLRAYVSVMQFVMRFQL